MHLLVEQLGAHPIVAADILFVAIEALPVTVAVIDLSRR
jgi:hypothetical protein